MRASSITSRRGIGMMVVFVLWVVTIAMIYALMSGQAQSGALTSLVRISGLRTVVLAAQSALAEASYVLRHPADGGSEVLASIHGGRESGEAWNPQGTRVLYDTEVKAGRLVIDPVMYAVALKPAAADDPYQIDLTVRVKYTFAGTTLTRQLRRRVLGHICTVESQSGPDEGTIVFRSLTISGNPLVEVLEP